jgi:hypothetical protein
MEILADGDSKKTKPICGRSNLRNISNNNGLWRFWADGGSKKTKPIKAKQSDAIRRGKSVN